MSADSDLLSEQTRAKANAMIAKANDFLLQAQSDDGAWLPQYGPAVTALAVKSLWRSGKSIDTPKMQKAIAFILSTQRK